MAAMKSSLYGITIFVVFQLLLVVCNGEGDYDEYDVINQCRFRESLYHHLGSTKWSTLSLEYLSSVLKLKIPRHSLSLDDINCKLMITPFSPSLGTVLNFVDSRGSSEWNCTNFLEVTTYKSGNYSKTEDVCKYANVKPLTFDSTTGSTLLFHFNQSLTPENPQFTIYATAYIHGCNSSDILFRCTNNRCIYPGFKCDGVNNCGDNSDEDNCGRSLIVCDSSDSVFRCNNDRCIWRGFKCNGANDCGDNSDEYHCENSQIARNDHEEETLKEHSPWVRHSNLVIAFAASVLVFIACIVCFISRKTIPFRIGRSIRKEFTVQVKPIVHRINNADGTPPYTTLSEETVADSEPHNHPPPPYSTLSEVTVASSESHDHPPPDTTPDTTPEISPKEIRMRMRILYCYFWYKIKD